MPQAQGNIMDLLMQGDPQGAFLAKMFAEGKMPGDPGANLNFVLNMLSPGAVAERQAQGVNLQDLTTQLGLDQGEYENFVRQNLGLQLGPGQEAALDIQRQATMADMFQAMMEQMMAEKEYGLKERETVVKEKGETRQGQTDAARRGLLGSQAAQLDESAAALRALTSQREQAVNLRRVARTGINERGEPMAPQELAIVRQLVGMNAVNPTKLRLAADLLRSGLGADREYAARIIGEELGMDTSEIAAPGWAQNLRRIFDSIGITGGVVDLGETPTGAESKSGMNLNDLLLQEQRQMREDLANALKEEQ